MPYRYQGRIAENGSSRGVEGTFAGRGWAVVQLDIDGGNIPWHGLCIDVQRRI